MLERGNEWTRQQLRKSEPWFGGNRGKQGETCPFCTDILQNGTFPHLGLWDRFQLVTCVAETSKPSLCWLRYVGMKRQRGKPGGEDARSPKAQRIAPRGMFHEDVIFFVSFGLGKVHKRILEARVRDHDGTGSSLSCIGARHSSSPLLTGCSGVVLRGGCSDARYYRPGVRPCHQRAS